MEKVTIESAQRLKELSTKGDVHITRRSHSVLVECFGSTSEVSSLEGDGDIDVAIAVVHRDHFPEAYKDDIRGEHGLPAYSQSMTIPAKGPYGLYLDFAASVLRSMRLPRSKRLAVRVQSLGGMVTNTTGRDLYTVKDGCLDHAVLVKPMRPVEAGDAVHTEDGLGVWLFKEKGGQHQVFIPELCQIRRYDPVGLLRILTTESKEAQEASTAARITKEDLQKACQHKEPTTASEQSLKTPHQAIHMLADLALFGSTVKIERGYGSTLKVTFKAPEHGKRSHVVRVEKDHDSLVRGILRAIDCVHANTGNRK